MHRRRAIPVHRWSGALLLGVAASPWAQAWEAGPADWLRMAREGVYAAWNPQDSAASNRPGLKVAFFGSAAGCARGQGDGVVAALPEDQLARTGALTGLAGGAGGLGWTPSGASPGCAPTLKDALDDSLVALNPAPGQGGIGLYTGTGPGEAGRTGFFGPFDPQGQNGRGANANIEASFVNLRFDWRAPDALRPWARRQPRPAVHLAAVQGVAVADVPAIEGPRPTQAKQQMTLGFINAECMRARPEGRPRPCQLKYLFTVAIVRSGVSDWRSVGWFQGPRIMFDAGQGGIPVIDGPLPEDGRPAVLRPEGLALYESEGSATQHAPFRSERFAVRISWEQFTDTLRAVAGAGLHRPAARVSDGEIAALFGPRWDDPEQWSVLGFSLGQEVSNGQPAQRAAIGGHLRTLHITDASRR